MPAIVAALHVLGLFITAHDPKNKNMGDVMKTMMLWICPFISWLCAALTMGHALGAVSNIGMAVCVFLGILFMVIGNYLPKCTPSFTMGIKLPWTLSDDENWRRTHRLAGPIWVIGGLAIALSSLLRAYWLTGVALAAMLLIPTLYSYIYYKKHR